MSLHPSTRSTVKRWFIFNFVGAMGICVQMGTLLGFTSCLRLNYLVATALAVEAAVLHNFFWHERWTWADRIESHDGGFFPRLLFFHMANGAVSIAGNLILMKIFVDKTGLHYVHANILAIAICSILNFLAGDRGVFRATGPDSQKGGATMIHNRKKISLLFLSLAFPPLVLFNAPANAADLRPETLKAWNTCVEMAERRIGKELSSQEKFLAMDFQNPAESSRERREVLSGQIPIRQMTVQNLEGGAIKVPDGIIHHWRGSVFLDGVTLDYVFSRVTNPGREDTRQEDVLDSRVLEAAPGQLKLYLKLQRSKIVTVVYNTEHLVRYKWRGTHEAYSSSSATKISEIERLDGDREREKPEGHDRGFLWRMNSYWRYQQVAGGVIVECESMTLSRSIPSMLEYMVRPIINKVARESMHRTLQSMKARILRSYVSHVGGSQS